jgi:D-alanyl-D-alanine carboxypeptidase
MKWKILGITGLVVTGLAAWSGIGQAQGPAFVDQREATQEQRIQDGVRSGALTPREAGRLEAEQQRIRDTKARMRADGRLNPNEKAMLDRMQNRAERDISREKHDRQVASPQYGHNDRRFHHEDPGSQRRLAERNRWQQHRDRRNDWHY